MNAEKFIKLINYKRFNDFCDIPDYGYEIVKRHINEEWTSDNIYSIAMDVYKFDDEYVGVFGVYHLDKEVFKHDVWRYNHLPVCIAIDVIETQDKGFEPVNNSTWRALKGLLNYSW